MNCCACNSNFEIVFAVRELLTIFIVVLNNTADEINRKIGFWKNRE